MASFLDRLTTPAQPAFTPPQAPPSLDVPKPLVPTPLPQRIFQPWALPELAPDPGTSDNLLPYYLGYKWYGTTIDFSGEISQGYFRITNNTESTIFLARGVGLTPNAILNNLIASVGRFNDAVLYVGSQTFVVGIVNFSLAPTGTPFNANSINQSPQFNSPPSATQSVTITCLPDTQVPNPVTLTGPKNRSYSLVDVALGPFHQTAGTAPVSILGGSWQWSTTFGGADTVVWTPVFFQNGGALIGSFTLSVTSFGAANTITVDLFNLATNFGYSAPGTAIGTVTATPTGTGDLTTAWPALSTNPVFLIMRLTAHAGSSSFSTSWYSYDVQFAV